MTKRLATPVDKLKELCPSMLREGEGILLDSECSAYRRKWPLPQVGAGRAFLTEARLIWIRHWSLLPSDIRRAISIPDVIEVPLRQVRLLRRERWGFNSFLIRMAWDDAEYYFRLGLGPYPLLRRNPETSEEWYGRLQALREA